jgi:hypothetical protein
MATLVDVIEQVRTRLDADGAKFEDSALDYAVEAALPACLQQLAEQVSTSPFKQLLQKDFTVALISTAADLTSSLTATEPMLIVLPFTDVIHANVTLPFLYVPDRRRLSWESSYDFAYYTLDGQSIIIKAPTGVTVSGNLTVKAAFIPSLSSVQSQLIPLLVECLVKIISNAIPVPDRKRA